jgi:uncharacterized membrane protein
MVKNRRILIVPVLLIITGAVVFAQAYASTGDAMQAGYIAGYAEYAPNLVLSNFSENRASRYANGFINDHGFEAGSNAWNTIKNAYKIGYEKGWRDKAAELGSRVTN